MAKNNEASKNNLTSNYIKGGQLTKNEIVMFWQNVKMVATPVLVVVIVLGVFAFYNMTESYERYMFTKYIHAEVHLDSVGNNSPIEFVYPAGNVAKVYAEDILLSPKVIYAYERLSWLIQSISIVGLLLSVLLFVLISKVLNKKGQKISEEFVVDGVKPVENKRELIKLIEKRNNEIGCKPKYSIVEVPFYDDGEILHIGISGNPGQGKTQIMIPFVEEIYQNKDKAIIYDKARAYTELFYTDNEDVILNPLDQRSPPWNIHAEARNATDYDSIFEAMIPIPPNTEPYWTLAARTVASKTALRFRQAGEYRMEPLLTKLYNTTLEEIAEMLKGTEAGALIDKDNPKTGESIRSIMSTYIKCLGYCYDSPVCNGSNQDLSRLFSISQWVKDDARKGNLFITSQGDQNATLKPLITTFFNIAVTAGMSMIADRDRRIFVLLDELPALNKIPSITSGAAELRQFGFSFIGGWQLYSQLEEVYGITGAKTIAGLFTTRIQFYAGSEEYNVKHAAKQFGEYTVEKPDDSLSIGVGPYRDGANFRTIKEKRDCVTIGQISALPKLNGYIRMAGGEFPVAPFVHTYYKPVPKSVGMIERPLVELAMGPSLIIDDSKVVPIPESASKREESAEKSETRKSNQEDEDTTETTKKSKPKQASSNRKLGQKQTSAPNGSTEVGDDSDPSVKGDSELFDPREAERALAESQQKSAGIDIDLFD